MQCQLHGQQQQQQQHNTVNDGHRRCSLGRRVRSSHSSPDACVLVGGLVLGTRHARAARPGKAGGRHGWPGGRPRGPYDTGPPDQSITLRSFLLALACFVSMHSSSLHVGNVCRQTFASGCRRSVHDVRISRRRS